MRIKYTFGVQMHGDKNSELTTEATKSVPEFLHNNLEGLKEITLLDRDRYQKALSQSPQRIWVNYFPFLLASNFTPSRSILLGEECGSLCVYLLFHWPRKNRLHLYLPPMPMSQEALACCFKRINAFNKDYSGRLWWISGELKDVIEQSGNLTLQLKDEEFIYDPVMFQSLNNSKFRVLRYQLRRAERVNHIDVRLFTAQDKNECLALLEKWYQAKTDKNNKEINYFYTKACLQLFEQFPSGELYGYVYVIEGKICAFAFGGKLAGETGCSFLNITDHDYLSIGYFARCHFFKNMQTYITINDGGTAGLSSLKFVKNNLVPLRIDAVYQAIQKQAHEKPDLEKGKVQVGIQNTDNSKSEALNGLKPLSIEDQEIFIRCTDKAKKKSWIAFFPFLSSFGQRMQSTLYWELYRGSICLYYLSERPSGKRLSLYFPPFPFRSRTLSYAMDKVNRFNQNENGEITWIEEGDRRDFTRLGYTINKIEDEYIYSKESLDAFFKLYAMDDNITTRPYVREDEEACMALLERWRVDHLAKGEVNWGYDLKKSCLQNALKFTDGTLIGEVLLVDGEIQGVCFAGAINVDYVSFLTTITTPPHDKLKLFQQASMSQNFSASFYNNSGEREGESAPYLSAAMKPVARHQLFRARKISRKERGMFVREVKEINAALFIKAARELGLEVDIISTAYSYCVISNGKKVLHVYHNATSITDVATRKVTHNKYLSQNIFKTHGIPVPDAKIFSSADEERILHYVDQHKPVVIKPIKGSRSVGVTVDPQNAEEVSRAIALIQNDKVMVEQFIPGDSYRVLIYQGEIIDILCWLPPSVVGNGLDSLFDLVETKNDYYRRNNLYTIQIDFDYLGHQGVDMGFVPEKGQKISLHPSHEHYVGGEPVRISSQAIHPDNAAMFIKAAKVSGLALAGLDFISEDLGIAYGKNGAAVNEINSNPEVWPHFFCEQQEDLSAIKAIMTEYFAITDM
jgi:glutathione synthase/RimK-type ligase-like ATP-grasp enzyme